MKKQVMSRAWEVARRAAVIFGGRPAEYIREAMRMAWQEVKEAQRANSKDAMIERLEAMGCKRWQKAGYDRLYINAKNVGLYLEYYKTGNIQYAEWKGEKISNSQAYKLVGAKCFIDVETMTVHGSDERLVKAAEEMLKAAA